MIERAVATVTIFAEANPTGAVMVLELIATFSGAIIGAAVVTWWINR